MTIWGPSDAGGCICARPRSWEAGGTRPPGRRRRRPRRGAGRRSVRRGRRGGGCGQPAPGRQVPAAGRGGDRARARPGRARAVGLRAAGAGRRRGRRRCRPARDRAAARQRPPGHGARPARAAGGASRRMRRPCCGRRGTPTTGYTRLARAGRRRSGSACCSRCPDRMPRPLRGWTGRWAAVPAASRGTTPRAASGRLPSCWAVTSAARSACSATCPGGRRWCPPPGPTRLPSVAWSGYGPVTCAGAAGDLALAVDRISAGVQVRFPCRALAFLAETEFRLGRLG